MICSYMYNPIKVHMIHTNISVPSDEGELLGAT